jgi:transcriptional regulator with XRE-family HTH domain
MAGANPTIRQRELGTHLRQIRNGLNLTVEEVATELLCSAAKISRIETGMRRPSLRDVRDLCALYKVDESTTAELMDLTRMAREPGWWTQYGDLGLGSYIGLEQDAKAITCFTMYGVPALLQTEDYAREIVKAIAPQATPLVHEQRVEARLRRQQVLEQKEPPRYRALLDEAVLRRRVGSPAVMVAQIDKILKMDRDSKATVQVIPFDVGAHAAQDSNFVLLEFQEPMSSVIFIEGLTGNQYLERQSDLDYYREAIEHLRDSALTPRDSVERMIAIRKEYVDEQ